MKQITVFTGNRAEFGILFPVICELSKYYELDIILSGAHVLPPWDTYQDSVLQLEKANISFHAYKIELSSSTDIYTSSLSTIYDWMLEFYSRRDTDYGVVLGDRVESFGFALATFYSRIPLVHICGGDVTEVSNFDTNVRHSITKLAGYHMATSAFSQKVLLQLGEEEKRIKNIGNPSFDYERMGYLTPKKDLIEKYHLSDQDKVGIFTFHPAANKTAYENMVDFQCVFKGVVSSHLTRILITYPNNDPGYDLIVEFLSQCRQEQDHRIQVERSLGTFNYLGIMKEFDCIIVGNSSSGLLETPFYQVPVINIGERQNGRVHGNNVIQCEINELAVKSEIDHAIDEYHTLKEIYRKDRFIFGDGKAAVKAADFLAVLDNLSKEEKLFKRFIVR